MKEKLYKVLVDGESCSGGDMKWSLPKKVDGKWVPGDWHKIEGDIKICTRGLHLTKERFNWYKWGCTAYEAEAKGIEEWESDKCVCSEARLLKEVPHPKWWIETKNWIDTLKDIAWLKPDGKPNKEWKLFEMRNAAVDAAGNAARDAAWDAAWNAAGNAALYARGLVVSDLKLETKHRTHIKKRMEVWQKGYGLLCDIDDVLYVYKKVC